MPLQGNAAHAAAHQSCAVICPHTRHPLERTPQAQLAPARYLKLHFPRVRRARLPRAYSRYIVVRQRLLRDALVVKEPAALQEVDVAAFFGIVRRVVGEYVKRERHVIDILNGAVFADVVERVFVLREVYVKARLRYGLIVRG